MIAEHRTVIDGHIYEKGEKIPDFGTIECVAVSGTKRSYQLMSKDISKLPHYKDLAPGSSALTLDTGELLIYSKKLDEWKKL